MNKRHIFISSGATKKMQFFLTAIGAVGIPAIFLPFTYNCSPLGVAWSQDMFLRDMWRLSWPFFLPVLITTATVRWIILNKHFQTEIIASYILSAAILCVTFSGYLSGFEWPDDAISKIALVSPFFILSIGIFVVWRNRKKLIPGPNGAIIVLQVAYLTNCSLCLIGFIENWQIAAYLSVITAIAYIAQIVLLLNYDISDKSADVL